MKLISKFIFLLSAIFLLVLAGCESSEQPAADMPERITLGLHEHAKTFGNYTVHVNALTTDQLPSEVARAYQISRSKSRIILNVVITQKQNGTDKPVMASVTSVARNLAAQLKNITMREIIEEDAIYYIGELSVAHGETLIFDIDVKPTNISSPYLLTYKQQFFTK
ncbi:MAG: DUF4426 domain-containing protein [Proteobacteria bacterium]|nr:DUF4426 domain-containing protein [Pseudomonadota bacterium]